MMIYFVSGSVLRKSNLFAVHFLYDNPSQCEHVDMDDDELGHQRGALRFVFSCLVASPVQSCLGLYKTTEA